MLYHVQKDVIRMVKANGENAMLSNSYGSITCIRYEGIISALFLRGHPFVFKHVGSKDTV